MSPLGRECWLLVRTSCGQRFRWQAEPTSVPSTALAFGPPHLCQRDSTEVCVGPPCDRTGGCHGRKKARGTKGCSDARSDTRGALCLSRLEPNTTSKTFSRRRSRSQMRAPFGDDIRCKTRTAISFRVLTGAGEESISRQGGYGVTSRHVEGIVWDELGEANTRWNEQVVHVMSLLPARPSIEVRAQWF